MCLHPDVIDALVAAGATVQMIAAAYRAAWKAEHRIPCETVEVEDRDRSKAVEAGVGSLPGGRQTVVVGDTSVQEPSPLERKRRADRERMRAKRANKSQLDLFPVALATSRDIAATCSATEDSSRARSSSSFLESKKEEGGGGGARATPLVLISPEAVSIADEVAVIAGLDPTDRLATSPGWCGAAARVQTWLAHWTRETILAGARAGMAGKRDGPPETPRYFEKPIARVHLQLTAPIPASPEVSYARVRERRPATDWQSRRDNWHASLAELAATVAAAGGG